MPRKKGRKLQRKKPSNPGPKKPRSYPLPEGAKREIFLRYATCKQHDPAMTYTKFLASGIHIDYWYNEPYTLTPHADHVANRRRHSISMATLGRVINQGLLEGWPGVLRIQDRCPLHPKVELVPLDPDQPNTGPKACPVCEALEKIQSLAPDIYAKLTYQPPPPPPAAVPKNETTWDWLNEQLDAMEEAVDLPTYGH